LNPLNLSPPSQTVKIICMATINPIPPPPKKKEKQQPGDKYTCNLKSS
jgi:hypothetical protein